MDLPSHKLVEFPSPFALLDLFFCSCALICSCTCVQAIAFLMAPKQSSLSKFLYAGRVNVSGIIELSDGFESCGLGQNAGTEVESESFGDNNVYVGTGGAKPAQSLESDLQMLDPVLATPLIEAARTRRQKYEGNCQFKDTWAARLPWAESVVGNDGQVCQVRCIVCSEVEGREKLLMPKLDTLWKHAGRRRALVDTAKLKKGQHFFLTTCSHVRNERIYFARSGSETVVQKVQEGATSEKKNKLVQFRVVFSLLSHDRLMTHYKDQQALLWQLRVPDMPKRHWSVGSGWDMACSMAAVLAEKTKKAIADAEFFSISADEVTTIDHESWLSLHIYVPNRFKRLSILLGLQRLVDGNRSDAVTQAIVGHLMHHGGLDAPSIASKLVSFGADGVSVFQGSRSGVTKQLQDKHAPFMLGIHCMAHRTNLTVQPISNFPIVAKLESLCQAMYSYFSASPKKHLEFQKIADLMETEGLKMLLNVKTRWISLLDPLRRVLGEYKALVAKMCEDAAVKEPGMTSKQAAARDSARLNYELLCDVSTFLALPCIMPMLECMHSLMTFNQSTHVFVSDYVAAVKIAQAELYMMYIDPESSFQPSHFQQFCDVVADHSYTISHEWVVDLNDGSEALAFRIGSHSYSAHQICGAIGAKLSVSRSDFEVVVSSVKGQCKDAAEMLISELDKRFPQSDLMNAFSIIFPQFWLATNADDLFPMHIRTLRSHYCVPRVVTGGSVDEPEVRNLEPMLDPRLLGVQTSLFKLTMKSNSAVAMAEPKDDNPLTKMWSKIGQNALMRSRLSEFIKLAHIAITAVLGSVEDERTFSTLAYMKSKVRNKLGGHLDTCVKVFVQPWWTQESFPYSKAITHWSECIKRMEDKFPGRWQPSKVKLQMPKDAGTRVMGASSKCKQGRFEG